MFFFKRKEKMVQPVLTCIEAHFIIYRELLLFVVLRHKNEVSASPCWWRFSNRQNSFSYRK